MFSEKERYILNWIKEVSKIRPELNGFAICPFAEKSKFKIVECSVEEIYPIDGYQVIIFIVEDHFDLDSVQFWVDYHNKKHENWKFFEDCGAYKTYINGIQTNNGKYNLILGQPTDKLRKFGENLAKTSYYDLWDDEYLREILENDYDIIEKRDSNPAKSSDLTNQELKMSNHPIPDQGKDFINSGMTLITDPRSDKYMNMLREVAYDHINDIKRQTKLHEKIRNDDDYDDWEYGTEPVYGKKW